MFKIGLINSSKLSESRIALLPKHIVNLQDVASHVVIQKEYGEKLGHQDSEYSVCDINIDTRENIFSSCDIILSLKVPQPVDYDMFRTGQILFGWVHAVGSGSHFMLNCAIPKKLTVIEMSDLFENNRHIFWRNNFYAGFCSLYHAFPYWGRLPEDCKIAILGRGNVAMGAIDYLSKMGASFVVFDRKQVPGIVKFLGDFDVLVNCISWDPKSEEHLINRSDLSKMKKGAFIIDVSAEPLLGIETSRFTTFDEPVYEVDGILHYVLNHTPALFYKTVSECISEKMPPIISELVKHGFQTQFCMLDKAVILQEGNETKITVEDIRNYSNKLEKIIL